MNSVLYIQVVTYNWKRSTQLKAWLMGLERKRWPSRWRLGCRHSALLGPALVVVVAVAPVADGSRPVSERHDG